MRSPSAQTWPSHPTHIRVLNAKTKYSQHVVILNLENETFLELAYSQLEMGGATGQ
jgi:hypothetical protein